MGEGTPRGWFLDLVNDFQQQDGIVFRGKKQTCISLPRSSATSSGRALSGDRSDLSTQGRPRITPASIKMTLFRDTMSTTEEAKDEGWRVFEMRHR